MTYGRDPIEIRQRLEALAERLGRWHVRFLQQYRRAEELFFQRHECWTCRCQTLAMRIEAARHQLQGGQRRTAQLLSRRPSAGFPGVSYADFPVVDAPLTRRRIQCLGRVRTGRFLPSGVV